MNNVVLVGRLTDNPTVSTMDNGKKITSVNVAVTRNYKNTDGIYETDFIRCVLWNGIAESTAEYCKKGDVIGIKGRLQSSSYEDENQKIHYITEVVAERVTFLSSKPKEEKTDTLDKTLNQEKKGNEKNNKKKKADK
ncbi:MAG: single-stranded DNA-binding protein [Mollicutes bacterium]|nr:single-stranded DNA-binding protein [Mollicutes bacterium]